VSVVGWEGGDAGEGLFAVFDGHGGRETADYAAEHVGTTLATALRRSGGDGKEAMEGSLSLLLLLLLSLLFSCVLIVFPSCLSWLIPPPLLPLFVRRL